jgi:hypothetical protein
VSAGSGAFKVKRRKSSTGSTGGVPVSSDPGAEPMPGPPRLAGLRPQRPVIVQEE